MSMRSTRLQLAFAVATSAALSAGCSGAPSAAHWPPADFALDVRGVVIEHGQSRVTQRFTVWSDGLAAYREADADLDDVEASVPVFRRASVYRLHRDSVRTLVRLLWRSELFQVAGEPDRGLAADVREAVFVGWQALGDEGEIDSIEGPLTVLDRVVQITNSFLPEGVAFRYPDLAGESEPTHVAGVPAPHDSLADAVACHEHLVRLRGNDPELLVELVAVAIAAGEVDRARAAFTALDAAWPAGEPGREKLLRTLAARLDDAVPPP